MFINDEWLGTLGKLLAACKLNIGDVAIVNHLNSGVLFPELKEQLQPKHILMFDVSMQDLQLPFTIPNYQVQQYAGITFMTAPVVTLSHAATDAVKTEKRKLWEKLKLIFGPPGNFFPGPGFFPPLGSFVLSCSLILFLKSN